MEKPILELRGVTKRYPGVVALNDVSVSFYTGEVHAIVGENGAGKSTLIKTITGAITPTSGEVVFEQQVLKNNNPITSMSKGIAAIYQEFNAVPYLSVAENIFFGRQPTRAGFVDFDRMNREAQTILDTLGVKIDPTAIVKDLSVGYQQIVEIAKALSMNARVLIMDEPSAPLTNNEVECMFRIVRQLREQGVCIIYISHRMEEIFSLCDTVTVFRDGQKVKTMPVRETNEAELVCLMVNRPVSDTFPARVSNPQDVLLRVEHLSAPNVNDVSFTLRRGEILGLAGLVGAGRTDIANAIFGAARRKAGTVTLEGKALRIQSPRQAFADGIALIPEDRKKHGALMNLSIKENITFSNLKKVSAFPGIVFKKKQNSAARHYADVLSIKCSSLEQRISSLSGGNQQKTILARCLYTDCSVLIFDEPTRGIDVGAKHEIYNLMNQLVSQGKSILLISSEMPELLGMADRILVVRNGSIAGELTKEEATQEKIMQIASGIEEYAS